MEYIKLGHVSDRITDGDFTQVEILAGITAGYYVIVNVKGLVLTAAQVASHLSGAVDGDTLTWTADNVWPE